jgi:LytS/YehU family sensor histidine kinase
MRPVAWLGGQYPIAWPPRVRHLITHAVAAVAANLVIAAAGALVATWLFPTSRSLVASFGVQFLVGIPVTVIAYVAIVGGSALLRARAMLRARELEAAELTAELRTSQLAALRMQLQPHFLVNSLNAITALVRDAETAQAVRALSLLGGVLRTAITVADVQDATLGDELEFVQRYLELERLRFGERLRVSVDVPQSLRAARVPTFVLQPFVENAIKHGVLRERTGNEIVISARATDDLLRLVVRDDGRGLSALPDPGGTGVGTGIANVRARLERMFGRDAAVSVADAADGVGVRVEITLPLLLTARTSMSSDPARGTADRSPHTAASR